MRIVMGVKSYETAHRLVQATERLGFEAPMVDAVNVLEPPGGALGKFFLSASEGEFFAQYLSNEEFKARTLLRAVIDELHRRLIQAHAHVLEGDPSIELLNYADEHHADLIAVHLNNQSYTESMLATKLARKLLMRSPISVLYHKDHPHHNPITKVVFATDHSTYAQDTLRKFISLRPKGVEQVTVMSAFPTEIVPAITPLLGQIPIDVQKWARGKFEEENAKAVELLQNAGFDAHSELREGPVHDAIAASMDKNHAGLLVLGSQGHGFLERMAVGSVSFHETIYGPYPTLVIRV